MTRCPHLTALSEFIVRWFVQSVLLLNKKKQTNKNFFSAQSKMHLTSLCSLSALTRYAIFVRTLIDTTHSQTPDPNPDPGLVPTQTLEPGLDPETDPLKVSSL